MATTAVDAAKLRRKHRIAYVMLYVVGGLNVLLGLAAVLLRLGWAGGLGTGWVTAADGVVMIVLGYFTMRRSLVAFAIAIVLYTVEGILTVAEVGLQAVAIRILILFLLVRGFLALRVLNQLEKPANPKASPRR